jgi:hypothetical protein
MLHLTPNSTTSQTHVRSVYSTLTRTGSRVHFCSLWGEKAVRTVKWQWVTHLVYAAGNFSAISRTQEDSRHSGVVRLPGMTRFTDATKSFAVPTIKSPTNCVISMQHKTWNPFFAWSGYLTLYLGLCFLNHAYTQRFHCSIPISVKAGILHNNHFTCMTQTK